jgi:hypothetical protein
VSDTYRKIPPEPHSTANQVQDEKAGFLALSSARDFFSMEEEGLTYGRPKKQLVLTLGPVEPIKALLSYQGPMQGGLFSMEKEGLTYGRPKKQLVLVLGSIKAIKAQ